MKFEWLIRMDKYPLTLLIIMSMSSSTSSFFKYIAVSSVMLGLTACVPKDQLVITQETVTEAKEDIAEGVNTRVNATVSAITETINTITEDLTGDAEITEEAAIQEEDLPPPSLDPKTLLGKSINELAVMLGTEDYRRLDQDVLILQYRMPSCIIDFVMSSDSDVSSYHGRHRDSGKNYDDISCRLDLAARRDGLQQTN